MAKLKTLKCKKCDVVHNCMDEVVFFQGDVEVPAGESYPDWDSVICNTCHEE